MFDYAEPIRKSQPKCMSEMLPAETSLLARARQAGVVFGYGTREPNMSKWMNQNSANTTNVPLKPKASTLSRTDMITFQ
jgi:hypothetical protein